MKFSPFLALLTIGVASPIVAAELKIELPAERTELKTGAHSDVAAANCVTCHSWDYVAIQPPLPRTAWKATVLKMRTTFGAPIAENQVDDIVDYLARTYGDEQPSLQDKGQPPAAAPRTTGDVPPNQK